MIGSFFLCLIGFALAFVGVRYLLESYDNISTNWWDVVFFLFLGSFAIAVGVWRILDFFIILYGTLFL